MRSGPTPLTALAVALGLASGCGADLASEAGMPACEPSGELIAMAQAVPTATLVPCIETLPVGWSFGDLDVSDGRALFSLDNDRVGVRSVQVVLEATCATDEATELPSGSGRTRRFLRLDELAEVSRGAWLHTFPGGCVVYSFSVPRGSYDFDAFNVELDNALGFHARETIAEEVERRYDAELDTPPGT